MKEKILSTSILNIRVSIVSKDEALAWIEKWIEKGVKKAKKLVVTPNPEQVMYAQKDRSLGKILNGASLALADGVGLLWASKILPTRGELKERVTGEEVMQELLKKAYEKGWKVFLLGGAPGVAEKTAEEIRSRNPSFVQATEGRKESFLSQGSGGQVGIPPLPRLRRASRNKSFKIRALLGARDIREETREERRRVIKEINQFEPDLLFVAYGAPWQEKWLANNLDRLEVGVAMVVGGALDMIVDPSLRPPKFMTRRGLDWMYRLFRQPWRIKRQLALVRFVSFVLQKRFGVGSF